MKSFLDVWLLEAPVGMSQELAGMVKLTPADQLPDRDTALTCQIELGDGLPGSFWVVVDAPALSRVLVEARVTENEPDSERDAQLWSGILKQVAARAAKAAGKESGAAVSVTAIHEVPRPSTLALVPYSLQFGEIQARIAFADQSRPAIETKTEAKPEAKTQGSIAQPLPPRGVELLLDIELEASLRFGSREMPLSEVLELGPGDVVQLERHISDPVDLIVGDKIVARGEVVLVNGNFGLRVTEVAEPRKTLESIRCLF